MVWMALGQCQCLGIIVFWVTESDNNSHNFIGILERKYHRAETLALYEGFPSFRSCAGFSILGPAMKQLFFLCLHLQPRGKDHIHSSSIETPSSPPSQTNEAIHLPIHTNPFSNPQSQPTPTRPNDRINNLLPPPANPYINQEPRTATTICATHNPVTLSPIP